MRVRNSFRSVTWAAMTPYSTVNKKPRPGPDERKDNDIATWCIHERKTIVLNYSTCGPKCKRGIFDIFNACTPLIYDWISLDIHNIHKSKIETAYCWPLDTQTVSIQAILKAAYLLSLGELRQGAIHWLNEAATVLGLHT